MTIVTSLVHYYNVVDSYIGVYPVFLCPPNCFSKNSVYCEIKCTPVPLGKAQKTQLLIACDH